jgi:molybdopterin-containing oxidoreductase family membrane subunit
MGEVVDYAPSWVEISITLGILAVGIFVVTVLVKPALIITQRYESESRTTPATDRELLSG